jgi:hypothetical protein
MKLNLPKSRSRHSDRGAFQVLPRRPAALALFPSSSFTPDLEAACRDPRVPITDKKEIGSRTTVAKRLNDTCHAPTSLEYRPRAQTGKVIDSARLLGLEERPLSYELAEWR